MNESTDFILKSGWYCEKEKSNSSNIIKCSSNTKLCIYKKNIEVSYASFFNIENIVGIVAILSGITGIIMGVASTRQASLDAVKEYFQQGDDSKYVEARNHIYSTDSNDFDSKYVADVCNFFHMWGLLNRHRYLPIWVFSGSSGVRVVELYLRLSSTVCAKRKNNPFYAEEFEYLAYRIYNKYKSNFYKSDFIQQDENFKIFVSNAKKHSI